MKICVNNTKKIMNNKSTWKTKENNKTAQPHTALSLHVYAVVLNTGGILSKNAILAILKISDFCQKFGFWVFLEVTGHSGILEISICLIFSRFQNFDFFDFLGGLKILAGGYGALLVGVSMM